MPVADNRSQPIIEVLCYTWSEISVQQWTSTFLEYPDKETCNSTTLLNCNIVSGQMKSTASVQKPFTLREVALKPGYNRSSLATVILIKTNDKKKSF